MSRSSRRFASRSTPTRTQHILDDEDSEDEESDSSGAAVRTPGRGQKETQLQFLRGLPKQTLKQLLLDIEGRGGLEASFKLKALCDLKPDIYGLRGTTQRRAIQNRVNRLKKLTPAEHNKLLIYCGVDSSRHTTFFAAWGRH